MSVHGSRTQRRTPSPPHRAPGGPFPRRHRLRTHTRCPHSRRHTPAGHGRPPRRGLCRETTAGHRPPATVTRGPWAAAVKHSPPETTQGRCCDPRPWAGPSAGSESPGLRPHRTGESTWESEGRPRTQMPCSGSGAEATLRQLLCDADHRPQPGPSNTLKFLKLHWGAAKETARSAGRRAKARADESQKGTLSGSERAQGTGNFPGNEPRGAKAGGRVQRLGGCGHPTHRGASREAWPARARGPGAPPHGPPGGRAAARVSLPPAAVWPSTHARMNCMKRSAALGVVGAPRACGCGANTPHRPPRCSGPPPLRRWRGGTPRLFSPSAALVVSAFSQQPQTRANAEGVTSNGPAVAAPTAHILRSGPAQPPGRPSPHLLRGTPRQIPRERRRVFACRGV